jgi:hypothetical protein
MILLQERKPEVRPVFVTVRDIAVGEELTCVYGDAYTRVGYKAGRKAPKPKWL